MLPYSWRLRATVEPSRESTAELLAFTRYQQKRSFCQQAEDIRSGVHHPTRPRILQVHLRLPSASESGPRRRFACPAQERPRTYISRSEIIHRPLSSFCWQRKCFTVDGEEPHPACEALRVGRGHLERESVWRYIRQGSLSSVSTLCQSSD